MNHDKTLKPYLVEAFYKWSLGQNLTPLIEVSEDYYNSLPEHVKRQQMVILNIHPDATHDLEFLKQNLEFDAVFSGENFRVKITYESIQKIFVKEDGYGLEFVVEKEKIKHPYRTERTNKIKQHKHLKLVK